MTKTINNITLDHIGKFGIENRDYIKRIEYKHKIMSISFPITTVSIVLIIIVTFFLYNRNKDKNNKIVTNFEIKSFSETEKSGVGGVIQGLV